MRLVPTDYEWRSTQASIGDEVRVPHRRHTTTIIPIEDDPDQVTVTYLSKEPDFDPEIEPESPNGGTLQEVNRMTVETDDVVPLNHFHNEVTLYPSSEGNFLTVYFLGPMPFEWGEVQTRSGDTETYRTERDPSR